MYGLYKIIQQATRVTYDSATLITSYIESGFQKRLKTGVVFVDLTAAYDTVWEDGLIHKLYNVIPCGKMVSLLEDMLSNRQFRVFVEDKSSKFRFINNGLPQGKKGIVTNFI
jgi:hypothetical protein